MRHNSAWFDEAEGEAGGGFLFQVLLEEVSRDGGHLERSEIVNEVFADAISCGRGGREFPFATAGGSCGDSTAKPTSSARSYRLAGGNARYSCVARADALGTANVLKGYIMEETFRLALVLNQSWETIDIKTGNAVLIPKGSYQAIRLLRKSPPDQTEENYLVVAVQHEGKTVLAGLREAYWRHWEGHYIPEFRVTIREMNEKRHPPHQKRP